MRRAEHLEHALQALLPDHITDADEVDVVSGNANREIALGDLEHEVEPVLALDGPRLDLRDQRRAVVRVDNRLADLESHTWTPSVASKDNTQPIIALPRFRRSGP